MDDKWCFNYDTGYSLEPHNLNEKIQSMNTVTLINKELINNNNKNRQLNSIKELPKKMETSFKREGSLKKL